MLLYFDLSLQMKISILVFSNIGEDGNMDDIR